METYRPEDAFGMNLQTFQFFGVWPSVVKNSVLRYIYKMYGYGVQLFYIVAILPTQFINIFLMKDDLQKLVDSSFFTLTCVGYITKLVVFLIRHKEIERFFERLRQPIFAPRRKEDLVVLKNATVTAKGSSLIYVGLTTLTVGSWILYPLVDSKQEKVLLFAAWYPYNTSTNPNYGYTYASQTILLLTTASMNSMLDMLTTNLYVIMVAQLEILKQDFREIADIIVVDNVSDTNYEFLKGTVSSDKKLTSNKEGRTSDQTSHSVSGEKIPCNMYLQSRNSIEDTFGYGENSLEKMLNKRIIKCNLKYEAILEFVKDVTDLFQIGIVVQICASSIIICATSYEMTSISPTTLQFYVVLQYQMCMLFQIFIYTWRGNDITVKTTELKDAVYECAWISVPNKKFRKSLCIIMSPLQVPLQLCVGKFFLLSVDMFFKIIKLAYSFYVLLKQVNAKKE